MFERVLIANRGEIARRVARTCRRMGIDYVAVYSDADRDAPHLRGAAARVPIGPAPAALSYINGEKLIRAALDTGCDAVHPGYGFLSENAAFADAVELAELAFVGPAPKTIADMGDKATAKAIMAGAGVPVVPGSSEASDDADTIAALLAQTGYPALLKPVAGGGGKGMAVVESGDGREEIESAIRTARSSFGDGRLLVERFVRDPRHIEVQIFGDGRGSVVHLFERECSLQRRHQKIVEEAPAANLPGDLRDAMIDAALRGARALAYRNAGTFEFIVGADGGFYFLEVNTRLQVEHPVTEEITGLDLVEWQLRVAAGESLPLTQAQIASRGHAIECRLYAEDPAAGFRPSPGRVARLCWPPNVRVESAVENDTTVPPDYDPMIAKLVVHAADRTAAIAAMTTALDATAITGITTNLGFLRRLLETPEVVAGTASTGFIDSELPRIMPTVDPADAIAAAAAAVVCAARTEPRSACSPWTRPAPFDRATLDARAPLGRIAFSVGGKSRVAHLNALHGDCANIEIQPEDTGEPVSRIVMARRQDDLVTGTVGRQRWCAQVTARAVDLTLAGTRVLVDRIAAGQDTAGDGGDEAKSPMPGVVVALSVVAGAAVSRGDVVAVVEAMKFENPVVAPRDGVVGEVCCAAGDQVRAGQVLVRLLEESGMAVS